MPPSLLDEEGFRNELAVDVFNLQKEALKAENIKAQAAANQKVADKFWDLATSTALLALDLGKNRRTGR